AVRKAIEISHEAGHRFYTYQTTNPNIVMSDITKLKCKLRGVVTEKFNSEIIWPSVASANELQQKSAASFGAYTSGFWPSELGPTLKIAEEFYTKNGLPINEDLQWVNWVGDNFNQRYEHRQASTAAGSGIDGVSSLSEDHRYYIGSDQLTAKLNFYREPRFYAWLGFDRGIWEMNGQTDESKSWVILARAGEAQGMMSGGRHNKSGYFSKKLVHMETIKNGANTGFTYESYTYPIIRLSDLYLLYAETLNESKQSPDSEVYRWIDSVRLRAALEPVVQSYEKYAIPSQKNKPARKDGMREIIKRERMIELSFESQRFFDLLRWKDALQYFNEPVKGWSVHSANPDIYYTVTTYWDQREFNTRDYFWPLRLETLQINSNLKQNPGW
ncbi:MAG: RagB/SusD family nutrient uptake outer membrane protein, partial [Prevotellaceae bacterium]|nr:RagB/SusD family nutrient uptake outer membrane protein [Prevotellaceae bacterium]